MCLVLLMYQGRRVPIEDIPSSEEKEEGEWKEGCKSGTERREGRGL